MAQSIAWIAGTVSGLGILLMCIAMAVDVLFSGSHDGEWLKCGWKKMKNRDENTLMQHGTNGGMGVAGEIWLWFGLLSILWALPGMLIAWYVDWIPRFRSPGILSLFVAAICAVLAGIGAFGLHSQADELVCDDILDVGASIIMAFVAGGLFLISTIILCGAVSTIDCECDGTRRPSRYASYDDYSENYCEPVDVVPCDPCAPKVVRFDGRDCDRKC